MDRLTFQRPGIDPSPARQLFARLHRRRQVLGSGSHRSAGRAGVLLLALGLFASACSSSSNDSADGIDGVEGAQASETTDADEANNDERAASDGGSAVIGETIDQIPGDPRDESVGSALDDRNNDAFPTALIDVDAIRSGGPPPDGIPPLDDPRFISVDEVDFLEGNSPVLLVEVEGDVRVYPVQIMTWHELVNDTVGGVPITVAYCPLCNSALTYSREIDGRVLDFGTSGSLFNSSLVMYDRQTETLWTHYDGKAVVGALTGTELEFIATSTVAWSEIVSERPDALVLSQDTGFARDYGRNPYQGYDNPDGTPFLFEGAVDDRLLPQTRVLTVVDDEAVAIPHTRLTDERVVEFTHQGEQLVAFLAPGASSALETDLIADGRDVGSTGVFRAVAADGSPLTFTAGEDGVFVDTETDSSWSVLGEATDGPLLGERLEGVSHLDTFWFSAQAFRPDIELLGS